MEKYVKVKMIGEGSFGKAILVKRKNDGMMCVIKEIGISRMSPKEREDSKKEVKVLSQLKHANIVTYMESFEGRGNLYIVMDYCEGGDLHQYITNQRGVHIEETKVLDIFVQCCLAVKYIHDRKILHRDIKTQNIFLTKDKIVKLGDFGIARVLKSTMELAHTCIGTPYYLSPEIVENRPYNNKSDIWSLGCVLYEMATLKHAFEAGNMKNLVMKIVRGSYPPVSNRYSFEVRSLIAQTFKRSPVDRPSINSILKKPIIQKNLEKFLSSEELEGEFSDIHVQKPKSKPPIAVAEPVSKKALAVKRNNEIANIYGASLAKKPVPNKKPVNVVTPGIKPRKKVAQHNPKSSKENSKEIAARERRRQHIAADAKYLEDMNKAQKQRWERQNLAQMKIARGAGWKKVLGVSDVADEQQKNAVKDEPPDKLNACKDEKPVSPIKDVPSKNAEDVIEQKPGNNHAVQAVPQKPNVNVVAGNLNGDRAKLLEDYWQRKKEAEANRNRDHQDVYGKVNWNPPNVNKKPAAAAPVNNRPLSAYPTHQARQAHPIVKNKPPVVYPGARNRQEQDYLRQLEAIRYQNFIERRAMHQKGGNVQNGPGVDPNIVGDPRFDPEARKKKIQALKVKKETDGEQNLTKKQAEERAAALQRHQNNGPQKNLKPVGEVQNNPSRNNADNRPLPVQKKPKPEVVVPPVVAPVGIDTVMRQVKPMLMKSSSEGDLQEKLKEVDQAARRNWQLSREESIGLGKLPMEITASSMEATADVEAECQNISKVVVGKGDKRKAWVHDGKTQFVSNLRNKEISQTQAPTFTIGEDTVEYDNTENINVEQTAANVTYIQGCKLPGNKVLSSETSGSKEPVPDEKENPNNATSQTLSRDITCPTVLQGSRDSDSSMCGKTVIVSTHEQIGGNTITYQQASLDQKNITPIKNNNAKNAFKSPGTNSETFVISKSSNLPKDLCSIQNGHTVDNVITENGIPLAPDESLSKNLIESNVINPDVRSSVESCPIVDLDENVHLSSEDIVSDETCEDTELDNLVLSYEKELCSKPVEGPVEAWTESKTPEEDRKEEIHVSTRCETPPQDEEENEFHTPNVAVGLKTGLYDTAKKLLRTCSMPDLTANTSLFLSPLLQNEDANDADASTRDIKVDDCSQDDSPGAVDAKNNDEIGQDEAEINGNDFDEEEAEDYTSMLESMNDLLTNTDEENTSDGNGTNEEDDGDTVWESDEDESAITVQTAKEKELKLKEDLFSRNEESRNKLEDELGLDLFMKVYKHLQMIQDDENDELELEASEISNLLGDKEYLYQKILYLVMADAAYCEGNDGFE